MTKNDLLFTFLFIVGCIVAAVIFSCLINFVDAFTNNIPDKIGYEDGNIMFVEATNPLGSIKNQDVIVLSNDNIEIRNNSFIGNKRTTYPYNVLKEVSFSKSFNGYKVVIEYPSKLGFGKDKTTFYFNHLDIFNTLLSSFQDMSKNRCVITKSF